MHSADVIHAIRQIESQLFVREVEWFVELPSTNDHALAKAAEADPVLPRLIWAERQTAGRGRGSNAWWSAPGALTCSLLIDGPAIGLPPSCWPQVSMLTALAVADVLQQFLPMERIGLKWPNDVQIDGRKVCGILVESAGDRQRRLVVGMGLNVGNSFRHAPAELQSQAVALADVLAKPPSLPEVLTEWLQRWWELVQLLREGRLNLAERWSPQCVLSHERIRLTRGADSVEGVCRGITRDGALLLEVGGRLERHWTGTARRA